MNFIFMVLMMTMANASEITINFNSLRSEEGSIGYILFDSDEGFPDKDEKSARKGVIKTTDAKEPLVIKDLKPGEYAVAILHDEDNDGKMKTNFIGIPLEGFGFSNNPALFFGPPSFNKCKFKLDDKITLDIKVRYF